MGGAGLGKLPDAVSTTELIRDVQWGVVDCVRCDLDMVEDTPGIIPPGEFGGEGNCLVDEDGFGDKWREIQAAEIGHVVGEANNTWDICRVCPEFGADSQGGGGSVERVMRIDHILIDLFCLKLGGGGGVGGCGAKLGPLFEGGYMVAIVRHRKGGLAL